MSFDDLEKAIYKKLESDRMETKRRDRRIETGQTDKNHLNKLHSLSIGAMCLNITIHSWDIHRAWCRSCRLPPGVSGKPASHFH